MLNNASFKIGIKSWKVSKFSRNYLFQMSKLFQLEQKLPFIFWKLFCVRALFALLQKGRGALRIIGSKFKSYYAAFKTLIAKIACFLRCKLIDLYWRFTIKISVKPQFKWSVVGISGRSVWHLQQISIVCRSLQFLSIPPKFNFLLILSWGLGGFLTMFYLSYGPFFHKVLLTFYNAYSSRKKMCYFTALRNLMKWDEKSPRAVIHNFLPHFFEGQVVLCLCRSLLYGQL